MIEMLIHSLGFQVRKAQDYAPELLKEKTYFYRDKTREKQRQEKLKVELENPSKKKLYKVGFQSVCIRFFLQLLKISLNLVNAMFLLLLACK